MHVGIAKLNKSTTRGAGNAACMGDSRNNGFRWGNQKDTDHYEHPDINGSIILTL
jgi:hypothetical protein